MKTISASAVDVVEVATLMRCEGRLLKQQVESAVAQILLAKGHTASTKTAQARGCRGSESRKLQTRVIFSRRRLNFQFVKALA